MLSPPFILLAACALLSVGAGIVAAHVTAFTLDESLIEQSAVHYTSNLPHSLLHDVDARATNRLYSLVLSVPFHFLSASSAIRIDHVASVLLFISAAAPIYLLAGTLLRSRTAAAIAAVLSVAVPWLALTSALFTENLSYPLFWWTMLAASRAIVRPSARRDLLTLISIALLVCTRVQFVAVFAGYLLALLIVCFWRAPASSSTQRRALAAANTLRRGCPFTAAAAITGIAILAYARFSGDWAQHVQTLLGSYSDVVVHKSVPPNLVEAIGVELIALALGVGLLPALISTVWYLKSIGAHFNQDRRVVLLALGIMLVAFMFLTAFSQLGYLGGLTEERYFFYVVPVFWIGTFAAIEDANVRAGEIAACALAFAFLYGAIPFLTTPFGQEIAFLAPVESISAHLYAEYSASLGLNGLTLQDALAFSAVLAGLLTALVWRRWPALRSWSVVSVAAIVQLLFTGYAYAVINGDVQGVPGRTAGSVSALGWIDAHAGSSRVWWLDNLPLAGAPLFAAASEAEQRTALFWNSHLSGWAALPAIGLPAATWPLEALPNESSLSVEASDGLLAPAADARELPDVVGATDSPLLQLEGTPLAHSPDRALTLWRLSAPVRATWLARGLQPTGSVAAGKPVHVVAFAPARRTAQNVGVMLEFAPPSDSTSGTAVQTSLTLALGTTHRRIQLAGAASRRISLTLCLRPGQSSVSGTLLATRAATVEGQAVAAVLQRVTTSPPRIGACKQ